MDLIFLSVQTTHTYLLLESRFLLQMLDAAIARRCLPVRILSLGDIDPIFMAWFLFVLRRNCPGARHYGSPLSPRPF